MNLDIQYKIHGNPICKNFIREHSYWYKELNRNPENFNNFISDMKDKYELRPSDKFNKMLNNINLIQSFLDALK